jgi:alkaline phosphatase D
MQRRDFLHRVGWSAAGLVLVPYVDAAERRSWPEGDPFALGVASGEPRGDGFAIWARLAPKPLGDDPDAPGGLAGAPIDVAWEVARDDAMREVVARGTATASIDDGWSVHVEVDGLDAQRPYWYRFASGDAHSRIGRATTTAVAGASLAALKIAYASCANYEHGYFASYRHLADEMPDVVLFLGDYVYEGIEKKKPVRHHSGGREARTLADYRNRYAQYRLDPDLQRLHAEATVLVTWDDHEVQNDYADKWSQTFDDPDAFLQRRAAAYRAFYEHMPVRPSRVAPQGSSMRIYDRFAFGDLAQIAMVDGRQYRSREACYARPDHGKGHVAPIDTCPEVLDPARSMIGLEQEAWLVDGFARSKARWNVVAQDVLMAKIVETDRQGRTGPWTDDWNGYPASRARVLESIERTRVRNPIVLSGDIHSFWANDLKRDFDDPSSPTVATEFVGTSITSRSVPYDDFRRYADAAPHVKFFESRVRGYATVRLDAERAEVQFRAISDATDRDASVRTLKRFVIEDGRAGVVEG